MLWDIYIRSAWQALSSEESQQAAHLFQLAQSELCEEEADGLAPESDLGLALCALATQEDAELVHHLENLETRVHRCPPRQGQLCADKLAELTESLRQKNGHQLALDILQWLPETPERYRDPEWWEERQKQWRENPDQEDALEEVAVGLSCGWTLPLEQLETFIRALARFRRQRSQGVPLARLAELIRAQCRSLKPAQSARTLSRFCQIFLADGLPALADQLWFETLKQGALGAARFSKFLSRRLEKTNLPATLQVLTQGLSTIPPEQRPQTIVNWARFWLAHPSPRLYPLAAALTAELPADLRAALAARAVRDEAWELAGQNITELDLSTLGTPRERLQVVEQALQVPGLDTVPWLTHKVQLLEQLGERQRLPELRLQLARLILAEQPAQAEVFLRETLRDLGTARGPALECWLLLARAAQKQGQTVAARVRAERAGELAAEIKSKDPETTALLEQVQQLQSELGVSPVEFFDPAGAEPELEELPELSGPAAHPEEEELFAAAEPLGLELPPDPHHQQQVEQLRQLYLSGQFEAAQNLAPTLPDPVLRGRALANWGMICLQQGLPAQDHLEQAASLLAESPQLPESASLALGLSLLQLQAGEKYQALLRFQPAAIYTGEFPDFERGLYHYLGGQLESQPEAGLKDLLEAESIWTQLGETAPWLPELRRRLAELLAGQSDLKDLEPVLLRARPGLEEEPLQSLLQTLMRAAHQAGASQRVLEYARAAPAPLDAPALQLAAQACEKLEDYSQAADYSRSWAATLPAEQQKEALEKTAHYLECAGQAEQALELLDRVLVEHGQPPGDQAEARLQRALELRRQGRWQLSQYVLAKAEGGDREQITRLQTENALSLEQPAQAGQGPLALQFQAAVESGDLAAATACLQHLREGEEFAPHLPLAELQLLVLAQDWEAAGQTADRLAGEWLEDPRLPQLWRVRARLRRARGDYAGAREDTRLAYQLAPADGDLWQLACDCARLSDFAAAESHLRQLLEMHGQGLGPLHPLTQRTRLMLGQVLHWLERLAEARDLLSHCDRPGTPPAIRLQACAELGFLALKTSDWREAESYFSRANQQAQPDSRAALLSGWSRALASLGRIDEGQQVYRDALALDPSLNLDFADYLIWHQRSQSAWPLLESDQPRALLGRARILLEKGSRDQAEELYDQILPADSAIPAAAVVGGELAAAYGFYAQAVEQFRRALERPLEPYERVRAQLGQGRAHMALGQFQQAILCLQQASFLVAKENCWMRAEVLLALGNALRRVGQRLKAEATLQVALETALPLVTPRSARLLRFYQALGENWLEQGEDQKAKEFLEKGLQLEIDRNGTEARPFLTLLARIDKLQLPGMPRLGSTPTPRVATPRPLRAPAPPPAPPPVPVQKKFKRPGHRELVVFGRQFHALLQAGVPILRALASCQQPGSRLAPVLAEVECQVQSGNSMSATIAEYPHIFGRELACMFLVAEQSGRLLGVLQRWADDLETREQRRLQLQSALFYPLLVLVTCVLAIGLLMIVFVPLIRDTLVANNVEPPIPTLILLGLSDALRSPKLWLGLVLGGVLSWQILKKIDPSLDSWNQRLQNTLLGLPVLGKLYQLSLFSGYFHSFATLVESGVRLDLAIEMGGAAITHRGIQGQLKECRKNLLDGDEVGQAFEKISSAPGFSFQFVAIGMEAGKLPQMCRVVSHTLDMDFELASHALKALIEPAIMAVAGLATAFVVWAAISPTLSLINSL